MSDHFVSELASPAPVGLYVHVPYCASLCSYCDFFRTVSPSGVPEPFVDLLLKEASLYRQEPPTAVDTIYLGGGTPSLLTPAQIHRLLEGLRGIFSVSKEAEVSLEANPETVETRSAAAWREAGVTRLSLGAQSFVRAETVLLGRRCTPQRASEAVRMVREAGFENLSLDLMGGIPGQTPASLTESLGEALSLPLTHLSFYLLDLHRGTDLYGRVLSGDVSLPGEESTADLYELASSTLVSAGFEHYEISNFARPRYPCLHNLKYWRGADYIGMGPAAHGRFRGWLTANPRSVDAWAAVLQRGEPPHEKVDRITGRRRAEDGVIFGLRLAQGVPLGTVEAAACCNDLQERIDQLVGARYAEVDAGVLRLTQAGFLLSNEVIGWLVPDLGREVWGGKG
jgi:oxygen-independent coproporphyrinogen-3 oxidase